MEQKPNYNINQGPLLFCKFAKKQQFKIPMYILSMKMCIQNLDSFCQFVLKILNKNQKLTKSRAVTLFQILPKTTIYNTNVDLVNDNMDTKFCLNLSIRSQFID